MSPPRAGLGRATLYRNSDLRAVVDEYRARGREAHTFTGLIIEIAHLRLRSGRPRRQSPPHRRPSVEMLAEQAHRLPRLPAAPFTAAFGVTRTIAENTPPADPMATNV